MFLELDTSFNDNGYFHALFNLLHLIRFLLQFRWVNIGKERDGMSPDAVQYARALRPPYHLLSFLRIKGHSTKGMSCTDKNTMVSARKIL